MECDPSPSRHTHRQQQQPQQRYQAAASSLMSFGHSSLPYTPYNTGGHQLPDSTIPNTKAPTQNGPQNKDRDDSPMVGVCVQQSPVAIHWNIIVRCVVIYDCICSKFCMKWLEKKLFVYATDLGRFALLYDICWKSSWKRLSSHCHVFKSYGNFISSIS